VARSSAMNGLFATISAAVVARTLRGSFLAQKAVRGAAARGAASRS
jgi:hypothetical protein